MSDKKVPKDMSYLELMESWKKGCKWLSSHEQITNTKKNLLGEVYDHESYLLGLKRIELLEVEMIKRIMPYGRQ